MISGHYSQTCIFAIIVIKIIVSLVVCDECDTSKSALDLQDGILGEVAEFPWLGVLRFAIKLNQDDLKVAATGIVLVKRDFAIVNANDVAKVPKSRLRREATVMFISEPNQSWSRRLIDVKTHSAYQYVSHNTISLLHLDLDVEADEHPAFIRPICLPGAFLNTSDALYTVGLTDERLLVEKVIYKTQYVPRDLCDEFFKRASLIQNKMDDPIYYECGYAPGKTTNCEWDNGMVLVSNVTGHWTMVGFGVAGPACSAPVRFLDLKDYYEWIDSMAAKPVLDESSEEEEQEVEDYHYPESN